MKLNYKTSRTDVIVLPMVTNSIHDTYLLRTGRTANRATRFQQQYTGRRGRNEYRSLCSYYVINTYASLMYELKKYWNGIYK
jgi:hypothetical protein